MRKKKLNNLSAEELLAIVDETPQQKAMRTEVYQYMLDCDFKLGTKLIPNSLIYYYYMTDPKYKKKYNRRAFFIIFGKFYKSISEPTRRGYKLTWNRIPTEEDILQANIMTRKEQYEKDHTKRGRKSKKKEATKDIQKETESKKI